MPLYAYECDRCGVVFEAMAPMADAANPHACPDCGKASPRRFLPPACLSDCTRYTEGTTDIGSQFRSEAMQEFHLKRARKHGVNTRGRRYDTQLARFPGDPEAWVGSDTEVRQVLERRNWGAKGGGVNVSQRGDPVEPDLRPGISEKVVNELVASRLKQDPGQKREKVVEDVVNAHAPRKGRRIVGKTRKR